MITILSVLTSEISGIEELDLVVSIDKKDQVWYASIEKPIFLHTFQIDRKKVFATSNEFIAVSSNKLH